jgi:hypothetical protein
MCGHSTEIHIAPRDTVRESMSSRSTSLLRSLLTTALPFATPGAVMVVPISALSGCGCSDLTTVLPISQEDYARLSKRYGLDGVPASECRSICIPSASGASTGTSSIASTGIATGAGSSGSSGSGSGSSGGNGGSGGNGNAGGAAAVNPFVAVQECHLTTIEFNAPAAICTGTSACE